MKKGIAALILILIFCSFSNVSIKGMWQYCGGMYNGKKAEAPTTYILQRNYKKDKFEAFVTERGNDSIPGAKPERYETGNYILHADTCLETQTWCAQPSKTTYITITYTYSINNDTLTFKGTLPNGTTVEEYWKKVK
ncbi:MAG: hypothetical protein EOP51_14455 [Sphingobacteriales bacterium]|nr:MAG: hypothetical protein EOP51_14455 [Sphingobacteriales bacterium]